MKKRNIIIPIILIIIAMSISVFIYINQSQTNETHPYKIAFIRMKEGGQFWSAMRNGAREARTDTQTSVEFFSTISASDIKVQTEFVQDAIERNVDAIVITPSDNKALIEPLREAKEKGIKIVQLYNEIDDDENIITASVMTNTYQIGTNVAKKIINKINGEKTNVLLVSRSKNVSSSRYIEKGIMDVLKSQDNIKCNSLYAGSNINRIEEILDNYLNNYQTINYIIALDDDSSEGVSKYFISHNHKDNIYYMATSHSLSNIQNLETGIIDELLILNSFAMGYQGVYAASEILNGNDIIKQDIDYIFVTKETMFDEDVQRKLFILY
jgi:ribose transport system substrate-binding protein